MMNEADCPLLVNLSKVHTTPMGIDRIRRNLSLDESISDVVDYCKKKISSPDCSITRQGKNWYCKIDGICITVNAYSYTIITAHPVVECPRSGCIETTNTKRPPFAEIKSFAEFSRYYWYREELQKICRKLGLKSNCDKKELNKIIQAYFNGEKILPQKPETKSCHPELVSGSLTPGTSLIECGFCFNQRFRDFFSQQTGITNFKFNVDMVATARKVKETNDLTFTLGDLLDIFNGTKTYAKYDKISLQWNKFVQDFCADPATACLPNKLKTAALLWKEVRTSTREKIYTTELLKEFSDIINKEN